MADHRPWSGLDANYSWRFSSINHGENQNFRWWKFEDTGSGVGVQRSGCGPWEAVRNPRQTPSQTSCKCGVAGWFGRWLWLSLNHRKTAVKASGAGRFRGEIALQNIRSNRKPGSLCGRLRDKDLQPSRSSTRAAGHCRAFDSVSGAKGPACAAYSRMDELRAIHCERGACHRPRVVSVLGRECLRLARSAKQA